MNCPAESIWAQFVDDELTEIESRDLTAHLESCPACRELTAALKKETELLVRTLQDADSWEQRPETAQPSRLMYWMAAVICAAILLREGAGIVLNAKAPPALDWLSPLSLSGILNWLANALFYVIEEGGSLMASLISKISFVVLGLLAAGALVLVMRRIKRLTAILSLAAIMFALVTPSHAMEIRKAGKGQSSIVVPSNDTINDTLVAFGDTVEIDGTVTGDLIAFARKINVRGTVRGNIINFGMGVNITGNADSDVFAFGQTVRLAGSIGKDLWGFGQNVTVEKSSKVQNNGMLFGAEMDMEGDVGNDLSVFGGNLDIVSRVGRDLQLRGDQRILVRAPSAIGRNLDIFTKSEKTVQIDSGVIIQGKKKIELAKPEKSKYLTTGFYFGQLLRIVAAFFAGLLLFWLFPGLARTPLSTAGNIAKSGGIGFLAAVATPIAAVILAITLVGLPIALTALVLWMLGLYLAKILIARCISNAVFGSNGALLSVVGFFIGIVIVAVAVNLPYIGTILNFILILIGFGALIMAVWSGWRRKTEPTADVIA